MCLCGASRGDVVERLRGGSGKVGIEVAVRQRGSSGEVAGK
jgi:hypothetical protein